MLRDKGEQGKQGKQKEEREVCLGEMEWKKADRKERRVTRTAETVTRVQWEETKRRCRGNAQEREDERQARSSGEGRKSTEDSDERKRRQPRKVEERLIR